MAPQRSWRLKWLEITSVGSTLLVTIGGVLTVRSFALWVAQTVSNFGASLPAPTLLVLELVGQPASIESGVILVPTAVALLGAWANDRGRAFLGPFLLVIAPQLALLEVLLALGALALPFFTILAYP